MFTVVFRISLNLELIKKNKKKHIASSTHCADCLLFLPPFFFPNHASICPSVVSQLENTSRWKGSVPPDARWSIREGAERARVQRRGRGTTAQSALTCDHTAVTLPRAAPGKLLKMLSPQSLAPLAAGHHEKSSVSHSRPLFLITLKFKHSGSRLKGRTARAKEYAVMNKTCGRCHSLF